MQALDEETVERIATDFQRLQHYREFRPGPGDLSLLSPRMRDLLRALWLPLGGVKEALKPLLHAIGDQERQAVVERANEPEALVVTALFSYCHEQETSAVLVGQIASWVNHAGQKLEKRLISNHEPWGRF